MKFRKILSHALPVFLFAILAAGSNDEYSPPPYNSTNTRAKAQRGLVDAQNGKIEDGLYWAQQAKRNILRARKDNPYYYEENQETMDNDLDYIEDIISQIKDLERESAEKKRLEAEENDSLDEANQELDSLNFGDNDAYPDDPNQYIYQEPTIDSPGSSYEGGFSPGFSNEGG